MNIIIKNKQGNVIIKNKRGISLIEVIISIQIIMLILGLFSLTYIYLVSSWQEHSSIEQQLANERAFLQVITRDIETSYNATYADDYLYLNAKDGQSYRYNFKQNQQRLDRGIKKIGSGSYDGRVTMAVNLEKLQYNIFDDGIELIYKFADIDEKTQMYRFRGK